MAFLLAFHFYKQPDFIFYVLLQMPYHLFYFYDFYFLNTFICFYFLSAFIFQKIQAAILFQKSYHAFQHFKK